MIRDKILIIVEDIKYNLVEIRLIGLVKTSKSETKYGLLSETQTVIK